MGMTIREAWENHEGRGMLKMSPYPDAHERHFSRFKGRPVSLLEIGVNLGGSLELWRRYFGAEARIVGVDINPACSEYADEGIEIRIGDQGDPAFLAELVALGPFDIVIDDGGHFMHQQILTFETLWPHVVDRGLYVCEDTCTSYVPAYGGGTGRPGTFMELVKVKIDEMHAWFCDDPETAFTRSATSIHVYTSMVVIEKDVVEPPRLMGVMSEGIQYGPIDSILSP